MWVNQPSTLQPYHKQHGAKVLVREEDIKSDDQIVDVWFTDGPVMSQRMHKNILSRGWR